MAAKLLTVSFSLATRRDERVLSALRRDAMTAGSGGAYIDGQRVKHARCGVTETLPHCLERGTVIGARRGGRWLAMAALDLDAGELVGPFVAPEVQRRGLGRRMVREAERLAVRFQLFRLAVHALRPAVPFYRHCGYTTLAGMPPEPDPRSGLPTQVLRRHFRRRQTRYGRRIADLLASLGLPQDYGRRHYLPLQAEAAELVGVGPDVFDRPRELAPAAAAAWADLRAAARADGVTLQLVSAYRSVDYQAAIVRGKLERGDTLPKILAVTAAPGFSEHHTGRALDLTTPGADPLEATFERTDAFAWLQGHGARHGFHLSYPRDNVHGIAYEPWHWCFAPAHQSAC